MSDEIALVLIKRIEALEEQIAELRKQPERPSIDLGRIAFTAADRMGFEPFFYTERN